MVSPVLFCYLLVLLFAAIALSVCRPVLLGNRRLRAWLLLAFARAPGGKSGLIAFHASTYVSIFLISLILATFVYNDFVSYHYKRLVSAYCVSDVVSELLKEDPNSSRIAIASGNAEGAPCERSVIAGTAPLTKDALFALLKRFGLNDIAKEQTADKITAPKPDGTGGTKNGKLWELISKTENPLGLPTIDFILSISTIRANRCVVCPEECKILQRLKLAASLAQLPDLSGKGSSIGPALLDGPGSSCSSNSKECKDQCVQARSDAIDKLGSRFRISGAPLLSRPSDPLTPAEVAKLAVSFFGGAETYSIENRSPAQRAALDEQRAILQFQSALIAEMRSTDVVRSERIWLNGVIGWERFAIIVCALVFMISLFTRTIMRLPHDAQRIEIVSSLEKLRREWLEKARPAASERVKRAEQIEGALRIGETGTAVAPKDNQGTIVTVPLRLLRAAIDEMSFTATASTSAESILADQRFVETIAEGERRSLDRSRILFDILLPTFPAIGFIGTVSSLLLAMSRADEIVKTEDPFLKALATANVTDILSLCFSTTLMALLCVLLLFPLTLIQQSQEDRLVDDVEDSIQKVLRPGSP